MGFATDAIHAGQEPDPSTGAITTPIYQTSTYVQEELGKHKGFEYARTQNPTRLALERGFAFGSGMAATTTITQLLRPRDHVVASNNMYGGTFRLFDQVVSHNCVEFSYVNTADLAAVEAAFKPNTKLLYVETPTNPSMIISDLRALASLARSKGAWLCVDNTFMTPYFQRPLELGAHLVVHSTTKYLNGHSDMVGGAIVSNEPAITERTLSASIWSRKASSISAMRRRASMSPALFTSTSMRPKAATVSRTRRSATPACETSPCSTCAVPPAAAIAAAAESAPARSVLKWTATDAPASPSARAAAAPMPLLAPVTRHALSSSPICRTCPSPRLPRTARSAATGRYSSSPPARGKHGERALTLAAPRASTGRHRNSGEG